MIADIVFLNLQDMLWICNSHIQSVETLLPYLDLFKFEMVVIVLASMLVLVYWTFSILRWWFSPYLYNIYAGFSLLGESANIGLIVVYRIMYMICNHGQDADNTSACVYIQINFRT